MRQNIMNRRIFMDLFWPETQFFEALQGLKGLKRLAVQTRWVSFPDVGAHDGLLKGMVRARQSMLELQDEIATRQEESTGSQ